MLGLRIVNRTALFGELIRKIQKIPESVKEGMIGGRVVDSGGGERVMKR
jgi:hypothetical protein